MTERKVLELLKKNKQKEEGRKKRAADRATTRQQALKKMGRREDTLIEFKKYLSTAPASIRNTLFYRKIQRIPKSTAEILAVGAYSGDIYQAWKAVQQCKQELKEYKSTSGFTFGSPRHARLLLDIGKANEHLSDTWLKAFAAGAEAKRNVRNMNAKDLKNATKKGIKRAAKVPNDLVEAIINVTTQVSRLPGFYKGEELQDRDRRVEQARDEAKAMKTKIATVVSNKAAKMATKAESMLSYMMANNKKNTKPTKPTKDQLGFFTHDNPIIPDKNNTPRPGE